MAVPVVMLVLAGWHRPALLAQSSATIAVSATVLPSPQLGATVASLDLPGYGSALSLTMGTTLLAAARGEATFRRHRASGAPDAGPGAGASAVPDGVLLQGGPAPGSTPKASGRPELPPTVRITLAYTAN